MFLYSATQQKRDDSYGKALLVFGADHGAFNSKRQIPADLAGKMFASDAKCTSEKLASVLHRLSTKPEVEEDDRVSSLPDTIDADTWSDIQNARLSSLVSEGNRCRFVHWMEEQLQQAQEGLASIEDYSVILAKEKQALELRRWQKTAKPVRPGSRILFLDGGGIRGLVLVEMLMEIERRTGRKITELFDWFIGTSIGSVVAVGLIYGELSSS